MLLRRPSHSLRSATPAYRPSRARSLVHLTALALLALALCASPSARADWMNLTGAETSQNIAEITVLDDRVRVVLEIYIGDLETFEDLVPDDLLKTGGAGRPSQERRLKHFAREIFQVVAGKDLRLPVRLVLAEPRLRKDRASPFAGMVNPITRQQAPKAPADKRVLYAELHYPFGSKPKELTFIPPVDHSGTPMVNIGFIAYHKAVPIIDFRYLSGSTKLTLDWDDPWYSRFENRNLKRHHDSAMMSFLYVEPREVRHEALLRVRDLQNWTDLGLSGVSEISPAQKTAVKEKARAFFAKRNPLTIDGKPVEPKASRAEFLNISLTGVQVVEQSKPLDASAAILGLILSYPVKHMPQNVAVEWRLFNDRIKRIPATSIDPAGPFGGSVEVSNPIFEWRNFLRTYKEPRVSAIKAGADRLLNIPVLSAALTLAAILAAVLFVRPVQASRTTWGGLAVVSIIGAILLANSAVVRIANPFAGLPDEEASTEIVSQVLNNVNFAFVEKDPEAVKAALSKIVTKAALNDVTVELDRALAIKVAGGGTARVKRIGNLELADIAPLASGNGFRAVASWDAEASAGHWGHTHRRRLRFKALLELATEAANWKLAGITVVDARQVK